MSEKTEYRRGTGDDLGRHQAEGGLAMGTDQEVGCRGRGSPLQKGRRIGVVGVGVGLRRRVGIVGTGLGEGLIMDMGTPRSIEVVVLVMVATAVKAFGGG